MVESAEPVTAPTTIIMLGIFLLGSLIILVNVMPIVSIKILSNAVAVEEDNSSMIYISPAYIGQTKDTDSQDFSGEIDEQGLQIIQNQNRNTKTNASIQISENIYISIGKGEEGEFIAVDRATCDAGDLAISGGISDASFSNLIQRISFSNSSLFSHPPSFAFDTWVAAIAGDPKIPDNDIFVRAWAECFDNPPSRH